ncbi:YkgJ family cysteine cluster protein [Colwellia sp. E2M01]|uniref:YkgJ family cysteine cluster protein n=1 Tax=Colwellia sp. E2M01 TaxID=2841561 RepID=UPI001C087F1C|nr:YkgJ family cysteine cluster protein [Colwellia sp. E2M01]MBU2870582.1 YkgJ family cysteine cluster protein [Colwellia sp. E2M01]
MKDCNQCGKCCIKYGGGDLAASQEEIDLWEIFNPEIFDYVKKNEIWFDPKTGAKLSRCPFLEVTTENAPTAVNIYTCSIYINRPEDCRVYPSLITEMIKDDCEMIEITDLNNLDQAQTLIENKG